VQEAGPVSDAKASLLAKLRKMAERMRPPEIAAPLKDVTPPVIEHEPSADANETDMIRFADAGETVTNRDDVTKRTASRNGSDPVTKPPDVTKPMPDGDKKFDAMAEHRRAVEKTLAHQFALSNAARLKLKYPDPVHRV